MTHHWTSAKLGLPRPRRLSVFYLDAGQPRVIRDRKEGIRLLLADLISDGLDVVGIGSDSPDEKAPWPAFEYCDPNKERLKP